MPERKAGDAPIADVVAACQAAYEKMTPGPWATRDDGDGLAKIILLTEMFPEFAHHHPENAGGIVTLVNHYPQLRAELERLQGEGAEVRGQLWELHEADSILVDSHMQSIDQYLALRADLQRKEAALRALGAIVGELEDAGVHPALTTKIRAALGDSNG